jgi:hypothetical protein
MKFAIQTINNEIVHDFSFQLLQSINFQNWLGNDMCYEKIENVPNVIDGEWIDYCPVGSVEFVSQWLEKTTNTRPKPINIPYCLRKKSYSSRYILDVIVDNKGVIHNKVPKFESLFKSLKGKDILLKSNERIKSVNIPTELTEEPQVYYSVPTNSLELIPEGNYIISEYVDITSEWRCFVYKNNLVGLSNYTGDFTVFPSVFFIKEMIKTYSENGAPVAYTLDVGVGPKGTFVIEVHDFFSCGLYGFSDSQVYPFMLYRWWKEYVKNNNTQLYGKSTIEKIKL